MLVELIFAFGMVVKVLCIDWDISATVRHSTVVLSLYHSSTNSSLCSSTHSSVCLEILFWGSVRVID